MAIIALCIASRGNKLAEVTTSITIVASATLLEHFKLVNGRHEVCGGLELLSVQRATSSISFRPKLTDWGV